MKVLITGANGMLARAAIANCSALGDDVRALTREQLDISDAAVVNSTLRDLAPDAVLNCAAYTDVDGAESHPDAARAVNVTGVENLARAAADVNARFVTVSTDYVFDGANLGFYTENDRPNPRGVYAITKFEGEQTALAANTDALVVRSGWIYGEGGTNFLSVLHRLLAEGKRIKTISDAYGTPTFAADLAAQMRDLAKGQRSGVFHVANSGPGTSYRGFAEMVCEVAGLDSSLIESVSQSDLKRPAPRPASSKLTSVRLDPLPDWEDALRRFLSERK